MLEKSCVKCGIELVCIRNDIALVHFLDNNEENGVDAIRFGDIFECPKCKCQIILGLGRQVDTSRNDQETLKRMVRFARDDEKLIVITR